MKGASIVKRPRREVICAVILAYGVWNAPWLTRGKNLSQQKNVNTTSSYLVTCSAHDYMLQDFDSGEKTIMSPDRKKRIVLAKDGSLWIYNGDLRIGTVELPGISADLSVIWALDSLKFGITYSGGGAEGAFYGHIYRLQGNRVVEISKPVQVAFDDFKQKHYCTARGNNEYVLGWGPESDSVFVVAQVFPTGDCGQEFGLMGGYLMDLDGNILRRYGDKITERISDSCWKSGRAFVR
jgi:hypothetical protein